MRVCRFLTFILSLLIIVFDVSVQPIKISGQVNTEDGTVLAGTSVVLKGTSTGTVTESDGSFKSDVSKAGNFTITISHIGYISQSKDFTAKADQCLPFNDFTKFPINRYQS